MRPQSVHELRVLAGGGSVQCAEQTAPMSKYVSSYAAENNRAEKPARRKRLRQQDGSEDDESAGEDVEDDDGGDDEEEDEDEDEEDGEDSGDGEESEDGEDSEDSEDSEEVWSLQPQSAQKGGTRFDVRPRSLPSCPADKKWSTYAACHFPNRWAKAQQSDPQKARLVREDDHSSSPGPRVMHRSSFERTLSTSSDVKSRKGFRRSGSAQSLNSSVSSSSNSADCERLSGATKRKEAKPAAKSSGSRFYADVVSRAQEANRRERSISIP